MNEKIKNKRPSLGWVMVPLIMLLAGGWFMWGFFKPSRRHHLRGPCAHLG